MLESRRNSTTHGYADCYSVSSLPADKIGLDQIQRSDGPARGRPSSVRNLPRCPRATTRMSLLLGLGELQARELRRSPAIQ